MTLDTPRYAYYLDIFVRAQDWLEREPDNTQAVEYYHATQQTYLAYTRRVQALSMSFFTLAQNGKVDQETCLKLASEDYSPHDREYWFVAIEQAALQIVGIQPTNEG